MSPFFLEALPVIPRGTLRKVKKKNQAGRTRRRDAQGLQEQVGCVEFSCGTAEGLVRARESELSEEKEGQQHGRAMLLIMGSD